MDPDMEMAYTDYVGRKQQQNTSPTGSPDGRASSGTEGQQQQAEDFNALRAALVEALVTNGVMGKIRAQLRASTLNILQEGDDASCAVITNGGSANTSKQRYQRSDRSLILALALIDDFFTVQNFQKSRGIFAHESNFETAMDILKGQDNTDADNDDDERSTTEVAQQRKMEVREELGLPTTMIRSSGSESTTTEPSLLEILIEQHRIGGKGGHRSVNSPAVSGDTKPTERMKSTSEKLVNSTATNSSSKKEMPRDVSFQQQSFNNSAIDVSAVGVEADGANSSTVSAGGGAGNTSQTSSIAQGENITTLKTLPSSHHEAPSVVGATKPPEGIQQQNSKKQRKASLGEEKEKGMEKDDEKWSDGKDSYASSLEYSDEELEVKGSEDANVTLRAMGWNDIIPVNKGSSSAGPTTALQQQLSTTTSKPSTSSSSSSGAAGSKEKKTTAASPPSTTQPKFQAAEKDPLYDFDEDDDTF